MIITETLSHNFKILVADDDPSILDLFQQVLSSSKFSPTVHSETEASERNNAIHKPTLSFDLVACRQGDQAVNVVKQSIENNRPFSAAFIDVRMPPGPDGIWTAEKIRQLDGDIEILIMTGYKDIHPQDISHRIPPIHKLLYFQKPLHIQEIYQFASAMSMKWHTECELQRINEKLEMLVEQRIQELIIVNKELEIKIGQLQGARSTLKKSEIRYRALAENSIVGIWQTTLDGYTLYINPAMCEMLEIDGPEALQGKTYRSFYSAEDQKIIKRELAKRKKGISSTYEVVILGQKGGRRNVMISGAPIFLSEIKMHSAIGTFTDITDKKRAENALMEAHKALEKQVEERTLELSNALETIKQSEKQLLQRKLSLEKVNKELMETNQAVSVLARNIDKKKENLEKKIFNICNSKLIPTLKRLQKDVYCKKREADLEFVISHLDGITNDSPFFHEIDSYLTKQEMRVALMIKNGLTSQQISDLLCISSHTVKTHRKNIRKKLNIDNKSVNLVSYLRSKLKAQD